MAVASLGYINLDVTDFDAWLDIVTKVFGMQVRPRADQGVDLRLDEFHHRMTIHPASADKLRCVGWELASEADLIAQVEGLRAAGVEVTECDQAARDDRKVRMLYRFFEQHAGVETELFYGPLIDNLAFVPTRGISGYKTKNMGLGHVVFHVADVKAATDFYRDRLGFNISDYIAWDGIDAVFLHCNPRHHSMAIMNCFKGIQPTTFNHIMFEALDFDDVGYAYDIVRDMGVPIFMDMGKHSNDHMQSFYIRTPSGFCIEYGFGGRQIDEDWEIRSYDQPMLFGHRMVG